MRDERPGLKYRDAGVDIDAATEAMRGIKDIVNKTFDDRVLQDIGSFGAMYSFDNTGMEEPPGITALSLRPPEIPPA